MGFLSKLRSKAEPIRNGTRNVYIGRETPRSSVKELSAKAGRWHSTSDKGAIHVTSKKFVHAVSQEASQYHNPFSMRQKGAIKGTTTRTLPSGEVITKTTYANRKHRRISSRGTTKVRPKTRVALGGFAAPQRQSISVFENVNPLGEADFRQRFAVQPKPVMVRTSYPPNPPSQYTTPETYRKDLKSIRNRADYLRRRYGTAPMPTNVPAGYQNPQQPQPVQPPQVQRKSVMDFPSVLN